MTDFKTEPGWLTGSFAQFLLVIETGVYCSAMKTGLISSVAALLCVWGCGCGVWVCVWRGYQGSKMHYRGGTYAKICQKCLIFVIFPFWLGEGGQSLRQGRGNFTMPRWCYHWISPLILTGNIFCRFIVVLPHYTHNMRGQPAHVTAMGHHNKVTFILTWNVAIEVLSYGSK